MFHDRRERERVVYRREIRPVGRERCEMRSEAENPKEGIASQRRKRVSNIHVAEHVSGDKPLSRKPLVLLLSLRKEALQIVAGLPRTFQPYRSSLPRINVAKLPINPCHCRLIAVISSWKSGSIVAPLCSFPQRFASIPIPHSPLYRFNKTNDATKAIATS